ncbi:MAG: endonuclease III [Candidatus Paceibacterota bacterium]|jgi:endonuclease-3
MKIVSLRELEIRKKKVRNIIAVLKKLYPNVAPFLHFKTPWELLVAVVLSAQCTDKKVNEVTKTLFKKYKTLNDYLHASQKEFEVDIYSTGFYRSKAKNILKAARVIHNQFHDEVPHTMRELLEIPGVGRKSANVILENAFGIVEGIAVDTHVRRLVLLWGLSHEHNPDKIEKDLTSILPKSQWPGFTHRLISYGREYCPSRRHMHERCPITQLGV